MPAPDLTPEQRSALIEQLEAKRAASVALGDGYSDRIKLIDERLKELRGD